MGIRSMLIETDIWWDSWEFVDVFVNFLIIDLVILMESSGVEGDDWS